jgi:drug/metabolite transporter (DMT)-like permease
MDLADAQARIEPSGRKRLSAANLALLLFAVGAAACGQLLLKNGMTAAAERAKIGPSLPVAAATTPFVWFGLTVFGISALAWLTALSRVPLSVAYPFNALGFLGVLTLSALVLHERTSVWTWVGTAMVVTGIIVVVTTRQT